MRLPVKRLREFALVVAWLVASDAVAVEYYKYKDENGKWVFTDKKPAEQAAETAKLLVTEARAKATVVNRGSRERPKLVAINQLAGPVQVWLVISQTTNMRIARAASHVWLVPAQSELYLTHLEKVNPSQPWSYQWQGQVALGPPMDAAHFLPPPLALPFKQGRYVVSQAFKGEASHSSHKEAFYAVDIALPQGTPIYAVRAGTVMDVERNFSRSGWSETYADEANYVRVLHADGSMAVYAHLDADSIVVGIGQQVAAGELLGASGNTGFSSGPHLHFALQINEGQALVSVPFEFAGFGVPQVGQVLLAP